MIENLKIDCVTCWKFIPSDLTLKMRHWRKTARQAREMKIISLKAKQILDKEFVEGMLPRVTTVENH